MATVKVYENLIWLPVGKPIDSKLDIDLLDDGAEIQIPTEPGERIAEIELMKIPHDPRKSNQTLMVVQLPGGAQRRTALYAYRALVVIDDPVNINIEQPAVDDADRLTKAIKEATS